MTPDIDIEGVTAESAARWLRGLFHVGDRAADCSQLDFTRCEVAFLNVLGDRASYRAAVERCQQLYQRGARCAVAHACGHLLPARYIRQGGIIVKTEQIHWRGEDLTAYRMIIPPAAWCRWCDKMKHTHHFAEAAQMAD
jgi:hypothetical protein